MLQRLISKLFERIYYVRFDGKRMRISNPEQGMLFDEEPLIAIEFSERGQGRVLAVGLESKSAVPVPGCTARVLNAFAHPRVGVGDFTLAEATLRKIFRRIFAGNMFSAAPTVIMHPLYRYDDELTPVELRVFRELALGAGARKVMLWTGRELADAELRTFKEPPAQD